jgi:biotin-(acetyl-CoA carboxylase) ligase
LTGRFEALDDDGALVLRVTDGSAVTVTAGELVMVRSSRA